MYTIGLIAGALLLAFVFYGLICLVMCVIEWIANDITFEVEHGLWEDEDEREQQNY